ncbi:MAG TPA: hypothetical protein VHE34_21275 [Puia sp.]|uniref:hypothetical protein n=1 Tax=Puia sp. TaxID=2045100 RepID=UPI002C07B7F9|nr:hypothetical protein [Puia sp.]HVU97776.1 hypothetical protein [Puia sp.]
MQIRYYINRQFFETFIPEIEVDAEQFAKLNEVARRWISVIADQKDELAKYPDGELHLAYNMEDDSVTPRDFCPYEVICRLSQAVYAL